MFIRSGVCLNKYFITLYFIHREVEKIIAGARDCLFTTDTIIQLLQLKCNDYNAIQWIDSNSDISDNTSDFEDCIQNSDSYPEYDLSTDNIDKNAPEYNLIG